MMNQKKYNDSLKRAIRSVKRYNRTGGFRNIAIQSKVIYIGTKYNKPFKQVRRDFDNNYSKVKI